MNSLLNLLSPIPPLSHTHHLQTQNQANNRTSNLKHPLSYNYLRTHGPTKHFQAASHDFLP